MAQERSTEQIRQRYGLDEQTTLDRLKQNWSGYVFILPTFLMLTLLFFIPMLRGIWMTFTNAQLGTSGEFIGLDNYIWLVTNDLFIYSFGWTIIFVFASTFLTIVVGLLAALLLNELRSGANGWMSAVIFSPYFSAPLASGIIWFWFLEGSFGLIPRLLRDFTGIAPPAFLAEGIWPFIALIAAQTWHDYAYAGIIYAAAVISIPREHYEAAAIDGAGRLRRFRDVTLPHILIPTIVILALRTAWNIAEFAQPFELTGGGPGTQTMLLSLLTYNVAYVQLNFARAYTIGMVMIGMSMTAAIIYIIAIDDEEDAYV